MATDSVDIRAHLAALGERRKQLDTDDTELMEEVREAIKQAKAAKVPRTEAARLLKMHRTTIYRVYDS